jgi:hypothetical protein
VDVPSGIAVVLDAHEPGCHRRVNGRCAHDLVAHLELLFDLCPPQRLQSGRPRHPPARPARAARSLGPIEASRHRRQRHRCPRGLPATGGRHRY